MILPEPRKDLIHQRGKAFLSTVVAGSDKLCRPHVGIGIA